MEDRKKAVLQELKEKFDECKADLGFEPSLEEIDSIFFVSDWVLESGFVSENFSRQLCKRIIDTYGSWQNYFHNLVMPAPGYIPYMTESKAIGEDGKKDLLKLIAKIFNLITMNTEIGLNKDKTKEREFIDKSVRFWNDEFKEKAQEIMGKVRKGWENQINGVNRGKKDNVYSG
tara:strand:- start:1850 stop:2371 length:522 start_codon:yes stop_codon:yes gene_type:complete